jgi:hypothetical protein
MDELDRACSRTYMKETGIRTEGRRVLTKTDGRMQMGLTKQEGVEMWAGLM